MSAIRKIVFARGGKTAFACAVCLGGLLGYFFPSLFVLFFGWSALPEVRPLLSLVGLGIFSGGYDLYRYLVGEKDNGILETLVLAGTGTVLVFATNFQMGYPVGMGLLIFFAGAVAVYGLTYRLKPLW